MAATLGKQHRATSSRSTIGVEIAFDSAFTSRHRGRLSSGRVERMSRTLITNGYVVTVDARRNVFPDGYVAIDGARIAAVGPASQAPKPDTFDEVIDARGAIVLPGLINMHQHHWYTLFKGAGRRLSAGRLGHAIPAAALAQPDRGGDARVEHARRHGNARDRHHLLAQSFGDDHDAGPGQGVDRAAARSRHPAGLRQGAALQDAGQPAPSPEPRRGAGGVRGGGPRAGTARPTGSSASAW